MPQYPAMSLLRELRYSQSDLATEFISRRFIRVGHNVKPFSGRAGADRCLTCGNCTLVCPTCFCTSVEETTDLLGVESARTRRWDSCFTLDFSYVHGGSVRTRPLSRYRQWMTHKLATWYDQFGSSGCVGCGRCITWCPVGIDITEEAAAIRAADGGAHADD